ncbi:MAG: cupin domain-containing protein [Acidimicrobiia bacterium]|nr:cupin domain-containing protein [Acidimicrobiia bacterium]
MNAVIGSAGGLRTALSNASPRAGADAGDPRTGYAGSFAHTCTEVGGLTCTPGGWAIDDQADTEVVTVLSRKARITDADRTQTVVGTGGVLPRGRSGGWDILEPLEKLHVAIEPKENI